MIICFKNFGTTWINVQSGEKGSRDEYNDLLFFEKI